MKGFVERTLFLAKPDAVQRGLVGRIIERFERAGLKMVGIKMILATKEILEKHFPVNDESWIRGMGGKSLENYRLNGVNPIDELGTDDSLAIGKMILGWNFEYLLSGPIVAIILEGPRAIANTRKLVGATIPFSALPGTIRGDFSVVSADFANYLHCSCRNLVHASGSQEEAEIEIKAWFGESEILSYPRLMDQAIFGKDATVINQKGGTSMDIENLEQVFEQKKAGAPREAAELAYVIARIAQNKGEAEKAVRYGQESIALFDLLGTNTLDECAAIHTVVNGIALPSLIHSDVVKDRLKPLQL